MKVIILILMIALIGCNKEDTPQQDCVCGTIANDGIDPLGCYWLEIRNDCSGNKKKFCFDEDIWMDAYVGTNFCVTGVSRW
jgi:hypothetical protein